MSLRDATENELLDYLLNDGAAPTPSTHLAAFTADPGEAGALVEVETPAANGYDRQALTPANWNAAAAGAKSNSADVTFGPATANWSAAVTHLASMSAATAGTAQIVIALSSPATILNTQSLRFVGGTPGAIVVSAD